MTWSSVAGVPPPLPTLGITVSLKVSWTIGTHLPRKTYDVPFAAGAPPPGAQIRSTRWSIRSLPADVADQA